MVPCEMRRVHSEGSTIGTSVRGSASSQVLNVSSRRASAVTRSFSPASRSPTVDAT